MDKSKFKTIGVYIEDYGLMQKARDVLRRDKPEFNGINISDAMLFKRMIKYYVED